MTYHARVTEAGELLVPAELARTIGVAPGDTLAIEQDGATLVITREADAALVRLRRTLRGYSVDQFIAERQADTGR